MTAAGDREARRRLGSWFTPPGLVRTVVERTVTADFLGRRRRPLRVLDPACGDGRFLAEVAAVAAAHGVRCELTGVDIDPVAAAMAGERLPAAAIHCEDALGRRWDETYDVVVGNPPFLSPLAASTIVPDVRRSAGPYADVAAEFLALAGEVVDHDGGRVAFVLPQSILAARDAASVRHWYDERSVMVWSAFPGRDGFDAQVLTCVLAFELGRPAEHRDGGWSALVAAAHGIPVVPQLESDGTLGDRAVVNVNFRDEYYGMVPAVGDHLAGPPLVTSGLIDPGECAWGRRPVTFARCRYDAPRIDLTRLDPKMTAWAERRLVPKVLVANQTSIVEAVADPDGAWLPAVPVLGAYPCAPAGDDPVAAVWRLTAVLTSPVASALVWHRAAGTGLSGRTVRLGPALLAELPWPTGCLDDAVDALRSGDVRVCGELVDRAYGLSPSVAAPLHTWWAERLQRIERHRGRSGRSAGARPRQ